MRTTALILAAGQGTRLRPLTDSKPKCLVEFAGKPLLEHQAATLRACGVENIVVVNGYCGEQISDRGFATRTNPKFDSTNMVSTLFCAEDVMRDADDLLICYGDIVYEPRVLKPLLASDAAISVMVDNKWRQLWELRMDDPLSDAETMKIAEDGSLLELGKKPTSYDDIQAQYMGLIKVRADHVQKLMDYYHGLDRAAIYDGKDFDNMYMTSFVQSIVHAGWDVRVVRTDNGWLEIDSTDDLARYTELHESGELAAFYSPKAAA